MHCILQDICGQEAQHRGVPLAIALACERNRGSASPFAPYLRLLPDGVPSLWMKPEQEIADFMGIIGATPASSVDHSASCISGLISIATSCPLPVNLAHTKLYRKAPLTFFQLLLRFFLGEAFWKSQFLKLS